MAGEYLTWLADMFEEAQVPLTAETEEFLDQALHRIAAIEPGPGSGERVYRALQVRFLKVGQSGRQLLAAYLRDEAYARRDSPMRPTEGVGFYTNDEYEGQPG